MRDHKFKNNLDDYKGTGESHFLTLDSNVCVFTQLYFRDKFVLRSELNVTKHPLEDICGRPQYCKNDSYLK